jgi:hypothetical protein
MSKYIIKDWAGNVCFGGREFDHFDDASEYLDEQLSDLPDDQYEEERGEFAIVENKGTREPRYLDSKDPRSGVKRAGVK